MKTLSFVLILIFSLKSLALEELVIVQTVSKSKKTFVVRKGLEDGITEGQTSLFTTESISLTARVVKANRHYSQWIVNEENAVVPFKKDQFVNFSNSIEKIWTEVPFLQLQKVEAFKEEKRLADSLSSMILRLHFNQALSETVSDIQSEETPERAGYGIELMFARLLTENVEWAYGVRYDQEVSSKTTPVNLDIPTTRILGLIDFTYNFQSVRDSRNHFYAGLGAGIGQSSTDVSNEVKSGLAMVLPTARVGYITKPTKSNYGLLVEASFESISAKESFSNGDEQTTNTTNVKLALGIKF